MYDGGTGYIAYGPGSTADGTYLGTSSYYDFDSTASYILNFSLPLQRLYITGKNANPVITLDATRVANAIAAGTFKQDCVAYTTTRLVAGLSEFDPIMRNYAARQLATRTVSPAERTTLRGMLTGTDANGRMGACQALCLRISSNSPPTSARSIE